MLIAMEREFVAAGYGYVMNQDPARRSALHQAMLARYRALDAFLVEHSPQGTFLFDDFGLAEVVFTPFFMRFRFLEYYENFELPADAGFDRVRRWRDACIASTGMPRRMPNSGSCRRRLRRPRLSPARRQRASHPGIDPSSAVTRAGPVISTGGWKWEVGGG